MKETMVNISEGKEELVDYINQNYDKYIQSKDNQWKYELKDIFSIKLVEMGVNVKYSALCRVSSPIDGIVKIISFPPELIDMFYRSVKVDKIINLIRK